MSRTYWLAAFRDGVEVDLVAPVGVEAASVILRPGAGSEASLALDPTDPAAVPGSGAWEIRLYHTTPGELDTFERLMSGGTLRGASYEEEIVAGREGSAGQYVTVRRAQIKDRHAAYSDRAPGETVTHGVPPEDGRGAGAPGARGAQGTDLYAELRYVAGEIGFNGAPVCSLPNIPIDRIDYTREGGFWGPIAGYLAPWGVLDFVDPDSGRLMLVDPTELSPETPVGGTLTLDDYNPATLTVTLEDPPTQAKVTYLDVGAGSGASPAPTDIVRDTETRREDDGSYTTTWSEIGRLHENDEEPEEITRTVEIGEGTSRTAAGGQPLLEQETTHDYVDDYTRRVKSTTTLKIWCELPYAGEAFRDVETTTETREYTADPDVANRTLLTRVQRIVSGTYVYTNTGDLNADILTATPVSQAAHSRTVDSSSDSSQSYGEGQISTWTEHYRRAPGGREMSVWGSETDDLRDRTIRTWHRTELGDNGVDNRGRPKVEYVGEAGRRAVEIDATKIGKALGLELADRLISRTEPVVKITLKLLRPDYVRYRLGWIVDLTDAPRGLSGKYLIREVRFSGRPPQAGAVNVEQTLELFRAW